MKSKSIKLHQVFILKKIFDIKRKGLFYTNCTNCIVDIRKIRPKIYVISRMNIYHKSSRWCLTKCSYLPPETSHFCESHLYKM